MNKLTAAYSAAKGLLGRIGAGWMILILAVIGMPLLALAVVSVEKAFTPDVLGEKREPVAIAVNWLNRPVVYFDRDGALHGHMKQAWYGLWWRAVPERRAVTPDELTLILKIETARMQRTARVKIAEAEKARRAEDSAQQ